MHLNSLPLKLIEKLPLLYFLATAMLFLFVPSTLSNEVYAAWGVLSQKEWGYIILSICLFHGAAMYWNGRNMVASRVARSIALIGYLWISLTFGFYFFKVAPWGCILFWGLIPLLVSTLFLKLVDEITYLRGMTND